MVWFFECHLNTGQPNRLKTGHMDTILFSYVLVWYRRACLMLLWAKLTPLNKGETHHIYREHFCGKQHLGNNQTPVKIYSKCFTERQKQVSKYFQKVGSCKHLVVKQK